MNLSSVNFRDYNRIYTGTNQIDGYDKPFLSFTVDSQEVIFAADNSTYFHYPDITSVEINAAGMIEIGACAGGIPACADRVYKKLGGYPNDYYYGNAFPEQLQSGVWLCAWLSGGTGVSEQIPIWMDRWYDPGYYDEDAALFVSNTSAVYDTPSRLTFDPKTWYRYDRMGTNTNEYITSLLSANSAFRLHFEDWNETVIDKSGFQNNGIISNFTTDCILQGGVAPYDFPNDTAFNLNGIDQQCAAVFSDSLNLSGNITYSAWIKARDWNNVKGHHIVSNNFRGGYCLKHNNGFNNQLLVGSGTNGYYIVLNNDGKIFYNGNLPGANNNACDIVGAAVDNEYYMWFLDNGTYNGYKHLYKVDYNGDILNFAQLSSSNTYKWLAIDEDSNIRVLYTNGGNTYVAKYDKYGNSISSPSSTSSGSMLEVDLSGSNIVSNLVAVDSSNNQYTTSVSYLSNAIDIAIDKDDNIWKVTSDNIYVKYSNTYSLLMSGYISQTTSTGSCNITFTNEYVDNTYQTYTWFIHGTDKKIYKYDHKGLLIKAIDTTFYNVNLRGSGDVSGYLYNRKFNYISHNKQPRIEAEVYISTLNSTLTSQIYTISYPCSGLVFNDWSMFSVNVDTTKNLIRMYINSVEYANTSIPANSKIFYYYNLPVMVGSSIGKNGSLGKDLGTVSSSYFKGAVDDVRVYASVLGPTLLRFIYNRKQPFDDLRWNMPVPKKTFIEEIERFFKFKIPGQKSQYYNIRLSGLNITDSNVRALIEGIIKDTVSKVAPLHTSLYKIIWD